MIKAKTHKMMMEFSIHRDVSGQVAFEEEMPKVKSKLFSVCGCHEIKPQFHKSSIS